MSNIKLFRLSDSIVQEIPGSSMAIEKSLQRLIEQHLYRQFDAVGRRALDTESDQVAVDLHTTGRQRPVQSDRVPRGRATFVWGGHAYLPERAQRPAAGEQSFCLDSVVIAEQQMHRRRF